MAGRKPIGSSHPRLDVNHRLPHPSSSAAARALPIAVLEERVEARHRQIQSLLVDNQRLAATHVALKQDLAATQLDLRRISSVSAELKAERDAEVRRIYEKSLKLDTDARAVAAMSAELDQVRAEARELASAGEELAAKLSSVESDLARARAEAQVVPAIKADIEIVRREIQRGRNAVELEKKTYAANLEQRRTIDNNMIIMAREIEKLRTELANAEKKARAEITEARNPSPGYVATHNPEVGHGGMSFPPDSYSMHQIQQGVDGHHQYASGTLHHPYDMQHTHVPR
ncbi:hypothetical protein HN51_024877 [Arachis hypogaea]|uniref:Protein FLC EXPRESSOR n=1 Tax=Arachis hypogaea TaxID=3818 RepID=A0A445C6Z8_ARAHY|nr:protein FLX-like 1 isoform X1 [Arachis hypogaea]QHO27862.1 Protein FLX-like [Arachis hypogaea]RYR46725.1 hypothetical protein Ahy_A07g032505 [Arachis hypogaea]